MELFRRSLVDSVSFLFSNRERSGPAEWARSVTKAAELPQPAIPQAGNAPPIPVATSAAPKPASWPKTDAEMAAAARPPGPWDTLPEVPGGEPPKKPETFSFEGAWKPPTGAFGLGGDKGPAQEPVSAFDRPQSVVIVGPNPLPVSFDFTKIQGGAAKPTLPQGERGAAGEGGAMGLAKAIGGRFLAVLAPLYALSTVLNQTNSGVGVFGKAVNVLGATLAPLLLPVFALLAAGVLSVSDIIWSKLIPALGGLYDWALKFGIPMAEDRLADTQTTLDRGQSAIQKGWELFKFADPQARLADKTSKDRGEKSATPIEFLRIFASQDPVQAMKRVIEQKVLGPGGAAAQPGGTNADGTPKQNIGQLFSQNMRDVLKSLAMSVGPKASYSSLGEVGKQAQLAALNADPIEMKAAQRVITSIQEFQKAFERYSSKEEPKNQSNRRPEVRS